MQETRFTFVAQVETVTRRQLLTHDGRYYLLHYHRSETQHLSLLHEIDQAAALAFYEEAVAQSWTARQPAGRVFPMLHEGSET